jgi:cytochrome c oxidase subunit 2
MSIGRMFPFLRRQAGAPPSTLLLSVPPLLFAAEENTSIFDTVSPEAAAIRKMCFLVLAVTGAIFLVVEGAIVYCIFHFRERGRPTTVEPAQLYGSKPVEVAWTVAPLVIVSILFLVVARIIAEARSPEAPPNALHVIVVGHQWWWEYEYPDQGFKTANELHIPAGRPIWFDLKSADVIHSFWFPRLNGKTDVIPGRTNTMGFKVDASKPDIYLGQCTEYCGTQHANMILRLEAESPEAFDKWVHNQKRPAVDDSRVRAGRDLFLANACMNCHTIRGTPAKGTFGPDLTHLASRQTLASAMVPNDRRTLEQWVDDPNSIKPGCWMPAMKLNVQQRDLIVDYLQTLK